MKVLSTIAAALLLALVALGAPASAKTPPPVTITVTTTCLVAGIMPSDYSATAQLVGNVGPVDLHSAGKGLLASNVTLPASVSYFGPVGVSTDNVYVTAPGSSAPIASVNVHTPCVKAPQGQA